MRAIRFLQLALTWLATMILILGTSAYVRAQGSGTVLIVGSEVAYQTIEAALRDTEPGDTIEVRGGSYPAPLYIDRSVSLIGIDNPVIDGHGSGSLVIITGANVRFEGFTVRNSGSSLGNEDTGIVVQAAQVTLSNNILENVLFGIYFANAAEGTALNNRVTCLKRELGTRGDGIRVWYSESVHIVGNEVRDCRDTLIWYAQHVTVEQNRFTGNRYGLHAMYSSNALIQNNIIEGSSVGSYLMYSQHVTLTGNQILWNRGPSGYGIAFKEMDYATVSNNIIVGNRSGLYIDNSPALYDITNTIAHNFIAYNDAGISALPSTERNIILDNTFLENIQQVSVLGRGNLLKNTWQIDGAGNYWSDYVGYDADGDGIGDISYRAERLFESLADEYPELRLFTFSPASQAIDFAASAFPSLRPDPRVIDDAPLMRYALPATLAPNQPSRSPLFLVASLFLLAIGSTVCLTTLRPRWTPPMRPAESVQTN